MPATARRRPATKKSKKPTTNPSLSAGEVGLPRLLTPEQVAKALSVSPKTLANWRTDKAAPNGPPYVRLNAREVRYDEVALLGWIRDRTAA